MPDSLTFMMGEFLADFPSDRLYADNHMWALPIDADKDMYRFGFTAYAVRLLQDVYFLDWDLEAPVSLAHKQELGSVESKKAESSLYSPIAGHLVQFNDQLMEDPSAINVDKYDTGWLFDIRAESSSDENLLAVNDYVALLDDVWVKTQRTIKGQMNE